MLARVLAGEPQWILADEPLANLDLSHALSLMQQFRQLAANTKGVVLVLHDLAMALNHADRVLVLNQGVLVADGAPETVLTPTLIQQVWGVEAEIVGAPGRYALSIT